MSKLNVQNQHCQKCKVTSNTQISIFKQKNKNLFGYLNWRFGICLFFVSWLLVILSVSAQASVKLKIAVVNPSPVEKKTTPITFDLPKGIGPEHIVDIGGMELKYDFNNRVGISEHRHDCKVNRR